MSDPIVPALKAGTDAVRKVLDDEPDRPVLQQIAASNPQMHVAAEAYARRAAVKQGLLLKLYQPLARFVGISRQYFDTDFHTDMASKLDGVPDESLVTPPPSVAIPTLEGLSYSVEEPDLKDMYLSLLATATDGRVSEQAHPSFAEVIKQLSAPEARMLLEVLGDKMLPIARLNQKLPGEEGSAPICTHVMHLRNSITGEPASNKLLPMWVDNWCRLGLVSVAYDRWLTREGAYSYVESQPEYLEAISTVEGRSEALEVERGLFATTNFGRLFRQAVSFDGTPVPQYPVEGAPE